MSDDFQEMVSMMAEDAKGAALVVALRRIEALEGENGRLRSACAGLAGMAHAAINWAEMGEYGKSWRDKIDAALNAAISAAIGTHSGTIEKPKEEARISVTPRVVTTDVLEVSGPPVGTEGFTIDVPSIMRSAGYREGASDMRARAAKVATDWWRTHAHSDDEREAWNYIADAIESLPLEPKTGGGV